MKPLPGDVICWCSIWPHPFFSSLIKLVTGKVVHVSIVTADDVIVEAMKEGLVVNHLSKRIAGSGPLTTVWHLPLAVPLTDYRIRELRQYYLKRLGTEYDLRQAIRSPRNRNICCDKKLFCSEAVGFGLGAAAALPLDTNYSNLTPMDVVKLGIWGDSVRLKGWRRL